MPNLGARVGKLDRWVIVTLVLFGTLVSLGPIFVSGVFPSQDGPAHLNTALTLEHLRGETGHVFSQYFEARAASLPNQFSSYGMAWIASLETGLDPEAAAWSMTFFLFAGIVTINLVRMRQNAVAVAPLLFMLMAGCLTTLGFLNFLIGLALFTQSVFTIHRGLQRSSVTWMVRLSLLAAGTYLAHPLAGLALGATVGGIGASYLVLSGVNRRSARNRFIVDEPTFSWLLPLGCGIACVLLLVLASNDALSQFSRFYASTVGTVLRTASAADDETKLLRTFKLLTFSHFVSYSPVDFVFAAGFGSLVGWLGWRRLRNLHRQPVCFADSLLGGLLVLGFLSIVVGHSFEQFFPERMNAALLIVLVIWLATQPLERSAARRLLAAGLALNFVFLLWRLDWTASVETVLTEYASVGPILPAHVSVVTLQNQLPQAGRRCTRLRSYPLPCRFEPTRHFMGRIIAGRPIALLTNYQLEPNAGFFPLTLRQPWSTYLPLIDSFESWPEARSAKLRESLVPTVARLLAHTPVDVVVTWDERAAIGHPSASFETAASAVLSGYRKIFTSRPTGAASVYVKQ